MRVWLKRCWILIVMSVYLVPTLAQDTSSDGYVEALRRIEEAQGNGATGLDLSGLGLQEVPPEIAQLSFFRYLVLSDNQLTTLPAEISQLSNLVGLDLGGNHLTTLPPEIGQLTELQMLYLNANDLTFLPREIGQLNQLEYLHLDDNELTSLPPEIGQLTQLLDLRVEYNHLSSLPAEIGQLKALDWLYLSGNELTVLPLEFGQLDQTFRGIRLDGNPLIFPPPEIQAQGTSAILAYLRLYQVMIQQRTVVGFSAGISGLMTMIIALRWRRQRVWGEKKKRM